MDENERDGASRRVRMVDNRFSHGLNRYRRDGEEKASWLLEPINTATGTERIDSYVEKNDVFF